jgi:Mg2+-importing ATPase
MKQDLGVLRNGIREGRRTLINVNKYVLTATSSNFGNMISMAAVSVFLPFLPTRPMQILPNNFLYDVCELPIPTDRVDDVDVLAPRRWDIAFIRNFMLCFGPLSSVFELLAFALLYGVMRASAAVLQTALFVQSMATQVIVIFVIRTTLAAWRDRPCAALALASVAVAGVAFALPFLGWSAFFGFVPVPPVVTGMVVALTLACLALTEAAKHLFYRLNPIRAAAPLRPPAGPVPAR